MRYIKIWLAFLKMSWMADFEYRLNIVLKVIGETGWYLAQLSVFEVLYLHRDSISGWDVHAMRVFMGTLFLVDVLFYMFLNEGIESLASFVRRGELDLYLIKPVNSQFMISMRKVTAAFMFNLIAILFYLGWAIRGLQTPVTPAQLLTFALVLVCGIVIQYALRFMFATLNVLLESAGNVNFIWHQFYRISTRPDPFFPFYLRIAILTVFPMAFFASVPSRILIEGADMRFVAAAIFLAAFFLWLSARFWNLALKHYSSASS